MQAQYRRNSREQQHNYTLGVVFIQMDFAHGNNNNGQFGIKDGQSGNARRVLLKTKALPLLTDDFPDNKDFAYDNEFIKQ